MHALVYAHTLTIGEHCMCASDHDNYYVKVVTILIRIYIYYYSSRVILHAWT
jgi:hypothetical protein